MVGQSVGCVGGLGGRLKKGIREGLERAGDHDARVVAGLRLVTWFVRWLASQLVVLVGWVDG